MALIASLRMNATQDSLVKFEPVGSPDLELPERTVMQVAPSASEALVLLVVVEHVADAVHAVRHPLRGRHSLPRDSKRSIGGREGERPPRAGSCGKQLSGIRSLCPQLSYTTR